MTVRVPQARLKETFEQEGYILLPIEYKNTNSQINFICKNGHKNSISWASWSMGGRCSKCSNNCKMSYEEVETAFNREGYKLLTKFYKNAHTKLEYVCPKGHKHSITWSNWNHKNKYRCPECCNKVSKQEFEIRDYLSSINVEYIPNHRATILNPSTNRFLELDFWLPTLNKAIEFNGDYWHKKEERVNKDLLKKQICDKLDIKLLIILYSEWVLDKEGCKERINNFCV